MPARRNGACAMLKHGTTGGSGVRVSAEQALVMSTGIIGRFLPMDKIAAGTQACAAQLSDTEAGFMAAARGICTTVNPLKTASCEIKLPSGTYRVAGMCKGAGNDWPQHGHVIGCAHHRCSINPRNSAKPCCVTLWKQVSIASAWKGI